MSQPPEYPGTGVDERFERPPAPPTRNRQLSRCYNVPMIVAYFVVLIVAVVALGSFGKKQADINQRLQSYTDKTCVLFVTIDDVKRLELHSAGVCHYVLWGLVSVASVVFVLLVYSIVLAAIGPKVISFLRIFDFVVMVLACLLSLSLSVIIHTGLDTTCANGCNESHEIFQVINSARVSSWITTILLLVLSVWYTILMIIYCYTSSQRRKQAQQYAHLERQDKELPAHV